MAFDTGNWIAIGGLFFMILAQALLGAWHMGRLHERQQTHSADIAQLKDAEAARIREEKAVGEALASMAETLKAMGREIGEIKAGLKVGR